MTGHRTLRLVFAALAGFLLAGTVTTLAATTAHAEDGYRFWGYYQWSSGQWAFAQKGADQVVPADGAVEGWRFAVGGVKPRVPRAAGDFDAICGKTPAETGKKRVALVVDPGTPEDAAGGETPGPATGTCVVTDPKATGAKILAAVAPVRIEKGLTCGIAGYPGKGCGDAVKSIKVPATDAPVTLQLGAAVGATPTASPSPSSDSDSGTPWTGVIIAAAAIVIVAGGGLALNRRRTTAAK